MIVTRKGGIVALSHDLPAAKLLWGCVLTCARMGCAMISIHCQTTHVYDFRTSALHSLDLLASVHHSSTARCQIFLEQRTRIPRYAEASALRCESTALLGFVHQCIPSAPEDSILVLQIGTLGRPLVSSELSNNSFSTTCRSCTSVLNSIMPLYNYRKAWNQLVAAQGSKSSLRSIPQRDLGEKGDHPIHPRMSEECTKDCPFKNPPPFTKRSDEKAEMPIHADVAAVETDTFPYTSVAAQLYTSTNQGQTRLLFLQPGTPSAEIVAELEVVDVVSGHGVLTNSKRGKVEYDALSYCWGDPSFCRQIWCNGRLYGVTDNLYTALLQLRRPDNVRILWIDALCINQYDNQERSIQVTNMVRIYKNARRVEVWLGEHGFCTRTAMEYLITVREAYALIHGARSDPHWPNYLETVRAAHILCTEHLKVVLEGLQDLLSRPWLRRIWVKQEVWAAAEVDVRCGTTVMKWPDLNAAPRFGNIVQFAKNDNFNEQVFKYGGACNGFTRPTSTERAEAEVGDSQNVWLDSDFQMDIFNVLRRTAESECSDPRDHVYGVLGMTNANYSFSRDHGMDPCLVVDYNKSVMEVFRDVARYIIRRDRYLTILLLGSKYGSSARSDFLPSWCPDWGQSSVARIGVVFNSYHASRDMDKGKNRHLIEYDLENWGDVDAVLPVAGFAFGIVTGIVETTDRGPDSPIPSEVPCCQLTKLYRLGAQIDQILYERQRGGVPRPRIPTARAIHFSENLEAALRPLGPSKLFDAVTKFTRFLEGDTIVAAEGAPVPLVIRPKAQSGGYSYVGPVRLQNHGTFNLQHVYGLLQEVLILAREAGKLQVFDLY